jgi:nicotinamide-nucleotide amidase
LEKSLFDQKLINSIKDWMVNHNETIAVAESVTSGLLQLALSSASEAMDFYQGGITAYNLGQKSRHLLVEPIHALSFNCVSEQVSKEMALNVCKLFTSNWGIGITGFASPVPESGNKLFAYYAISHAEEIVLCGKTEPVKDDPFIIQLLYVNKILKDFLLHLTSM